jgi:hypothetical protein
LKLLETLDAPLLAASDAALKGLDAGERLALIRLLDAIRNIHE